MNSDRACSWTGVDGVTHQLSTSSCWIAAVWFIPQAVLQVGHLPTALGVVNLGLQQGASSSNYTIRHQLVLGPGQTSADVTSQIQKLSTAELDVDSSTFTPARLRYSLLPDNGIGAPVKVEVRYSEYRMVSGLYVPGHIERYFNGSLQLSVNVTQVSVKN